MKATRGHAGMRASERYGVFKGIRRSFAEFLLLPTLIIVAFLLLAVGAPISSIR